MKLRSRPQRKVEKALDALTGVTKIWSDLQVSKQAGKGVKKAKRLCLPGALRSTKVKAIGMAAVAGGAAAIVARKLKGDGPQEYTGPPPSAAVDAAASAPDTPEPLTATSPDVMPAFGTPATGAAALRDDVPDGEKESAADASAPSDDEKDVT